MRNWQLHRSMARTQGWTRLAMIPALISTDSSCSKRLRCPLLLSPPHHASRTYLKVVTTALSSVSKYLVILTRSLNQAHKHKLVTSLQWTPASSPQLNMRGLMKSSLGRLRSRWLREKIYRWKTITTWKTIGWTTRSCQLVFLVSKRPYFMRKTLRRGRKLIIKIYKNTLTIFIDKREAWKML